MEKKKISFVSVFVVVVMLAAIFMPIGTVMAPPARQHNIWGYAEDGPDKLSAGTTDPGREISAWIDGVCYGKNITQSSGQFDLYVDGDFWGLDEYNAVKDGGWEGDSITYFLDYNPMYYYLNISDTTSIFNFSAYQQVDPMFFDTQTWTDSAIPGNTYLRNLKINEVVFDLSPLDDYIYIYDFGGDLTEAALEQYYYLEKDDPWPVPIGPKGPIFNFSLFPGDVSSAGGGFYYVNLNGFTLDDNDELKLVWRNPGTTIANGTDVIVDRVEWGNHVNYISTTNPPDDREYDNTTIWDCEDVPLAGESYKRKSNGVDTDNCSADFSIQAATPRIGGVIPGPPTDLTVHRGPYNTIGSPNDLVLYWTAPTVNYGALLRNIVYYDTDLSNGFQYTNYIYFAPNSTGAGADDWCVLPGWYADSNNYALIVNTTGDISSQEGGMLENPVGTNIGYKYGIELLVNPSPLTSQKWVSIPYICDWKKASDIAGPGTGFLDGLIIDAVLRWNYSRQDYDYWTFGITGWAGKDFNIIPGDAIAVSIKTTSPYLWKIVGSYDDTVTFEFLVNPSPLTSQMYTSLPYHKSYVYASNVAGPGTEFTDGSIIDAVLQWNYNKQDFDYWTFGITGWGIKDYAINPSPGDHLAFAIKTSVSYFWQPQVIAL